VWIGWSLGLAVTITVTGHPAGPIGCWADRRRHSQKRGGRTQSVSQSQRNAQLSW